MLSLIEKECARLVLHSEAYLLGSYLSVLILVRNVDLKPKTQLPFYLASAGGR
jgi:hypothetical protein